MKYYVLLATLLLTLGGGIFLGYKFFSPKESTKEKINTETILTALNSEGFLVSQSYIFEEKIDIDRSTGNALKDFFFGQDIQARAKMKVSSGVDLSKISQEDLSVSDKNITLVLPSVETFSVELIGDIEVQNKQGILKRLLNNDDGYNAALTSLKSSARDAVETSELRLEAKRSAHKEVYRFVRFIQPDENITIEVK